MRKLTAKMLLRFVTIKRFIVTNKRKPNTFEVMKMFNLLSTSSAHDVLKRYEEYTKVCLACGRKI